jgi:hypothetical protein
VRPEHYSDYSRLILLLPLICDDMFRRRLPFLRCMRVNITGRIVQSRERFYARTSLAIVDSR